MKGKKISKWLREYLLNARLSSLIVGVSGGIDSAVTSILARWVSSGGVVSALSTILKLREVEFAVLPTTELAVSVAVQVTVVVPIGKRVPGGIETPLLVYVRV